MDQNMSKHPFNEKYNTSLAKGGIVHCAFCIYTHKMKMIPSGAHRGRLPVIHLIKSDLRVGRNIEINKGRVGRGVARKAGVCFNGTAALCRLL